MKKWAPRVLLAAALAGLSAFLLKGDVWTFWTWWLLAFLMGMVAMPVTGRLFAGFEDKGWMFSKVLAITVTGFLTWFLVTAKILPFTAATCIGVSVVCAVGCGVLYHFQGKMELTAFRLERKTDLRRKFCSLYFSDMDLFCRIPSAGIRN